VSEPEREKKGKARASRPAAKIQTGKRAAGGGGAQAVVCRRRRGTIAAEREKEREKRRREGEGESAVGNACVPPAVMQIRITCVPFSRCCAARPVPVAFSAARTRRLSREGPNSARHAGV